MFPSCFVFFTWWKWWWKWRRIFWYSFKDHRWDFWLEWRWLWSGCSSFRSYSFFPYFFCFFKGQASFLLYFVFASLFPYFFLFVFFIACFFCLFSFFSSFFFFVLFYTLLLYLSFYRQAIIGYYCHWNIRFYSILCKRDVSRALIRGH